MNQNQRGPGTAPIYTQSQDLTPDGESAATRGVCVCKPPRGLRDCSCAWGMLIRKLIRWGYEYPCGPVAIRGLVEVASNAESIILHQREQLLREAAAAFDGPAVDFQTEYGISKTTFYRLGLRTKNNV